MSQPFTPTDGVRELSRTEVEAELIKLDMGSHAAIVRRADQLAGDYHGKGRDLLQNAIVGALTSRSCREGTSGEQLIAGIMRSIASTARWARERRGEYVVSFPVQVLGEQMAVGGYTVVGPDEIIEIERVRRQCEEFLDTLASASPQQAALTDGIGLGLREQVLAEQLGISIGDLATMRRALKRHAQRLWVQAGSGIFQP